MIKCIDFKDSVFSMKFLRQFTASLIGASVSLFILILFNHMAIRMTARRFLAKTEFTPKKLNEKEHALLKTLAADSVITDEEIWEYGVKTDLFSDKERFCSYKNTYLTKPVDLNSGFDKSHYMQQTLSENEEISLQTLSDKAHAENKDSVLLTLSHENKLLYYPVSVEKIDSVQEHFNHAQKVMGLENVPIVVNNVKELPLPLTHLSARAISISFNASLLTLDERIFSLLAGHEVSHVLQNANDLWGCLKSNTRNFMARYRFLRSSTTYEDEADSMAVVINPQSVQGNFLFLEYLGIINEKKVSEKDFVENIKNMRQMYFDVADGKDPHSESIQRLKNAMLIAARQPN